MYFRFSDGHLTFLLIETRGKNIWVSGFKKNY